MARGCENHIFSPGSANCVLDSGLNLTLEVLVETSFLHFPGPSVFADLLLFQGGHEIHLLKDCSLFKILTLIFFLKKIVACK